MIYPDNVAQILQQSKSFADFLRNLGIPDTGGRRRQVKLDLTRLGIEIETRKNKKYDNLENIVATSFSFSQVLRRLELSQSGSAHASLKSAIRARNIDTAHFTGKLWSKGKKLPMSAKREEKLLKRLTPRSHVDSGKVKKAVILLGLLENKCRYCGLESTWNNKPITLHLDHIDGDYTNNSIENLQILCPNCHSQTPTYCNKARNIATLSQCG